VEVPLYRHRIPRSRDGSVSHGFAAILDHSDTYSQIAALASSPGIPQVQPSGIQARRMAAK
jgi:hypothetical protein